VYEIPIPRGRDPDYRIPVLAADAYAVARSLEHRQHGTAGHRRRDNRPGIPDVDRGVTRPGGVIVQTGKNNRMRSFEESVFERHDVACEIAHRHTPCRIGIRVTALKPN
jgi:hypothetical protein